MDLNFEDAELLNPLWALGGFVIICIVPAVLQRVDVSFMLVALLFVNNMSLWCFTSNHQVAVFTRKHLIRFCFTYTIICVALASTYKMETNTSVGFMTVAVVAVPFAVYLHKNPSTGVYSFLSFILIFQVKTFISNVKMSEWISPDNIIADYIKFAIACFTMGQMLFAIFKLRECVLENNIRTFDISYTLILSLGLNAHFNAQIFFDPFWSFGLLMFFVFNSRIYMTYRLLENCSSNGTDAYILRYKNFLHWMLFIHGGQGYHLALNANKDILPQDRRLAFPTQLCWCHTIYIPFLQLGYIGKIPVSAIDFRALTYRDTIAAMQLKQYSIFKNSCHEFCSEYMTRLGVFPVIPEGKLALFFLIGYILGISASFLAYIISLVFNSQSQ